MKKWWLEREEMVAKWGLLTTRYLMSQLMIFWDLLLRWIQSSTFRIIPQSVSDIYI
jgi:hypothetical protein